MKKHAIPTAAFEDFTDFDAALDYACAMKSKLWIKASGLAAGKGAVFAPDGDTAETILREMMVEKIFGGRRGIGCH